MAQPLFESRTHPYHPLSAFIFTFMSTKENEQIISLQTLWCVSAMYAIASAERHQLQQRRGFQMDAHIAFGTFTKIAFSF